MTNFESDNSLKKPATEVHLNESEDHQPRRESHRSGVLGFTEKKMNNTMKFFLYKIHKLHIFVFNF